MDVYKSRFFIMGMYKKVRPTFMLAIYGVAMNIICYI